MELIAPAPLTEEHVRHLAEVAGLRIAPEHLPGVIRNLAVLLGQAALLEADALDPLVEPAAVFRP